MVLLKELKPKFTARNANSISTKEDVDNNFNIPKGSLASRFHILYDRVKDYDNSIIFGARGVGKTLYLKKAKFDYLYSKEGILPIFIDLSDIRETFKAADQIGLDTVQRRLLFHRYLRFLIILEITNMYKSYIDTKSKSFWNRFKGIFGLVSDIFGLKSPEDHNEKVTERIDEIRKNCEKPFDLVNLKSDSIEFKPLIKKLFDQIGFKDILDKEFYEILTILSELT
ncbi:hypothetical protein CEE45_07680 [Candidatus Heimdallarchaeota archaeon B3_Heim]|nr:MAG: hypothetical protein CEE45_07680 [Candidatus Heimdallarchaeota archaeon B3_Heim]